MMKEKNRLYFYSDRNYIVGIGIISDKNFN